MQTIIKAPDAGQLLAVMPNLIGMQPENSLVLMPFIGKRSHGGLRLDLPASSVAHKRVATYAVGVMSKLPHVDGAVLVVCVDSRPEMGLPQRDLVEVFLRRLKHAGFHVKEALCFTGTEWASYLDSMPRWTELDAADTARVRDQLPVEAASIPEPPVFNPAGPSILEDIETKVSRIESLMHSDEPLPPELEDIDLQRVFESALERVEDPALLIAALQAPAIRDIVMLQWSHPHFADDIWDDDYVGANLLMGSGPLPDRDRLERAIEVLARLREVSMPHRQLPLLCMLAWLHWAKGLGSRAALYIEAAASIDSSYGMACVLSTMFSNGMLPEWLTSRSL